MPASKKVWYRVTAPYVTLKTMTENGVRVVGLYAGAPVPFDVPQDSLDHHIRMGMVEEYVLSGPEAAALAHARGEAPETSEPEPEPDPGEAARAEQRAQAEAAIKERGG